MSAAASASPFSGRMIAVLVFVGLAATAALLLIVAFESPSASSRDGRGHPLSVGATGFKGLVTLSRGFGGGALADSEEEIRAAGLVVATVEPGSRASDLARLRALRRGRPTLLILPKWVTRPDWAHRGWVKALWPGMGNEGAALIGEGLRVTIAGGERGSGTARGNEILNGVAVPGPRWPQTLSGNSLRPLLALPGGGTLIAQVGDEPLYVAADPDLFNNHGLKDPAVARAALAILSRLREPGGMAVAFDLTLNGFGANSGPNIVRSALEPPFLPMILALVVAALLAGLHGAFRFGQARREARAIAFGKAALVENSAGLIKLARREARLGGAYAEVVRQDAARLTGAPPVLQGEALDTYLDRLSRDGPPFSALARALTDADTRAELVEAARALFQWKKDIIR
jgi:hypothetical protein